jgi:hypothetical protein
MVVHSIKITLIITCHIDNWYYKKQVRLGFTNYFVGDEVISDLNLFTLF